MCDSSSSDSDDEIKMRRDSTKKEASKQTKQK